MESVINNRVYADEIQSRNRFTPQKYKLENESLRISDVETSKIIQPQASYPKKALDTKEDGKG